MKAVAVAIRAKIYDSNGSILGTYGGSFGLNEMVKEARLMRFPLLSGVDSEDDTQFNVGQVHALRAELSAMLELVSDPMARDVQGLFEFCTAVSEGTHRKLVFIGD